MMTMEQIRRMEAVLRMNELNSEQHTNIANWIKNLADEVRKDAYAQGYKKGESDANFTEDMGR